MISAEHLAKTFGTFPAVKDVSFSVMPGMVLGFLGPNGAGKTTTMRMLSGCLVPDGGTARLNGYDVVSSPLEAKATLGYSPENAPAYPEMSVGAFLSFTGSVKGISGRKLAEQVAAAEERCHLQEVRFQRIGTLSKGYRHRVGLAQAILACPENLIFDEPTDGLDPNQKREVRNLIRELSREHAVIVSTHILEEVPAICTHVAVLNRGCLVCWRETGEVQAELQRTGGSWDSWFHRMTEGADSGEAEK